MRILLADDHQLFLDGLCGILREMDVDVELVCVRDGDAALATLIDNSFDIALIDLRLPSQDGFSLLDALANKGCLTPVIIVTASKDPSDQRCALDKGAMGFVPKSASCRQIIEAVRDVLRGEIVNEIDNFQNDWGRKQRVSPRQMEVLRLMAYGISNQDIADQLSLSLATVKSHVAALFERFDARSRTEAIEKARRLGLE